MAALLNVLFFWKIWFRPPKIFFLISHNFSVWKLFHTVLLFPVHHCWIPILHWPISKYASLYCNISDLTDLLALCPLLQKYHYVEPQCEVRILFSNRNQFHTSVLLHDFCRTYFSEDLHYETYCCLNLIFDLHKQTT